jgi:hypothetical protein
VSGANSFQAARSAGRSERSERRVGAAVGGREAVFLACSDFRVRSRTEEKGINKGKRILDFESAKIPLKTNSYKKPIAPSTYMFGLYCTVHLYVFFAIAPSTYMFCTVHLYVFFAIAPSTYMFSRHSKASKFT